jgi:hypothetical protein
MNDRERQCSIDHIRRYNAPYCGTARKVIEYELLDGIPERASASLSRWGLRPWDEAPSALFPTVGRALSIPNPQEA